MKHRDPKTIINTMNFSTSSSPALLFVITRRRYFFYILYYRLPTISIFLICAEDEATNFIIFTENQGAINMQILHSDPCKKNKQVLSIAVPLYGIIKSNFISLSFSFSIHC